MQIQWYGPELNSKAKYGKGRFLKEYNTITKDLFIDEINTNTIFCEFDKLYNFDYIPQNVLKMISEEKSIIWNL